MYRLNRSAQLMFQLRPARALLAGVLLVICLVGTDFLAAHDATQKDTAQKNTAAAVAASMMVVQNGQAAPQHDMTMHDMNMEGVPNSVAGWDGGLSSYYATSSL